MYTKTDLKGVRGHIYIKLLGNMEYRINSFSCGDITPELIRYNNQIVFVQSHFPVHYVNIRSVDITKEMLLQDKFGMIGIAGKWIVGLLKKHYQLFKEKLKVLKGKVRNLNKENNMKFTGRTDIQGLEGEIIDSETIKIEVPDEDVEKPVSVDILETAGVDLSLEEADKANYDYVDDNGIYYDKKWLKDIKPDFDKEEVLRDRIYRTGDSLVFLVKEGDIEKESIIFKENDVYKEASTTHKHQENIGHHGIVNGKALIENVESYYDSMIIPKEIFTQNQEMQIQDIAYIHGKNTVTMFTDSGTPVSMQRNAINEDQDYILVDKL